MEVTETNSKRKLVFSVLKLGVVLIAPLVLIIFPVTFFDNGQSICLSKLLLGMDCYACGLTRAGMRVIHLDFAGAYEYNPLIFIVGPLIVVYIVRELIPDFVRVSIYLKQRKTDKPD
jgi:hypothetical protein